jgi:hypothetical protein
MYKAKDGREFAHEGMGKSWDGHIAANPSQAMKPAEGGGDGEDPQSIVAEHGPAHTTHIKKEDDGTHSVHSQHKDGHMHKSTGHKSKEEAHEHSMAMMGDEEQEGKPNDSEEREGSEMAGAGEGGGDGE